ncbi:MULTISPECIES: cysteine desulfurase-like protein [unclassified Burkholderia]|uniref:cysteine desulfurase-like protein n=1 Tax=unclassified Burkholderia TaxID=2613784 RepID=UPI000F582D56|nr:MULTISPECIES: cysteine desulfurase-like protein [unclassified Burkholderia]RQR68361.1 cysteine desulfurase-like protein [Burkholderia sp. Bp9012]RQR70295.1 cysteine desulfurase-like protein [Burkholderia sp. Bp9011]RQR83042.1 cysteine desulfurase-like protein [Burkholderia sp. Bp9010]RQZ38757.1 cysteine desulfurase-like protein [Burkholderia sp. Bp9099]
MDHALLRQQFPVFGTEVARDTIFFDGAAGTQVTQHVIDRMVGSMVEGNANLGAFFPVSSKAVGEVAKARETFKDFFNANDVREVVFGQSMTTLTFSFSRAIGRTIEAGDEIVLTRMDHDANVSPWVQVAKDRGAVIKWIDFDPTTCEYDFSNLDEIFTPRTKVLAINYASNVTGTINNIVVPIRKAKEVGALVYVDAVQYAPHGIVDVQALGCDFLVCSAYKFYGPHIAILWGRLEVLEQLVPYKVRPASDSAPDKFETGTKAREQIAGAYAAVEHFAWIGEQLGGAGATASRRDKIVAGMEATKEYEDKLVARAIEGLTALKGLTIHGVTALDRLEHRVPTISFSVAGLDPAVIAKSLADVNINVWHGHNYGIEPVTRLGLIDKGGIVRVSFAQYNTLDEVETFLGHMRRIVG